jgi:hypothetical protein
MIVDYEKNSNSFNNAQERGRNIRLVKVAYSHIILYDIGHDLSYPPSITEGYKHKSFAMGTVGIVYGIQPMRCVNNVTNLTVSYTTTYSTHFLNYKSV